MHRDTMGSCRRGASTSSPSTVDYMSAACSERHTACADAQVSSESQVLRTRLLDTERQLAQAKQDTEATQVYQALRRV